MLAPKGPIFNVATPGLLSDPLLEDNILNIVIHDLQAPLLYLHRVTEYVDKMHDKVSPQEVKEIIAEMNHTTYQVTHFVKDLLHWLKNIREGIHFSYESRELYSFITTHCGIYMAMAKKKNLTFDIVIDESFQMYTDFSLLLIIIRNILDNSIKHTTYGGITISANSNKNYQWIIISDTGSGISNAKIKEIEQGIISTNSKFTSQIGFRIVYDLVKLLNGKLDVKSVLNKGTSISIHLPKV